MEKSRERAAAPGDVVLVPLHRRPDLTESCANLLNQTWKRSLGARMHSLERSSNDFPICLVLIVAAEGPALGHARLCRVLGLQDSLFVESVVVSAELRGKGYGRKLMEATERYARGKGFRNLYLTTHDKQDFYHHLGYRLAEPVQSMGSLNSLLPEGMIQKMMASKMNTTTNHHPVSSHAPPCPPLPTSTFPTTPPCPPLPTSTSPTAPPCPPLPASPTAPPCPQLSTSTSPNAPPCPLLPISTSPTAPTPPAPVFCSTPPPPHPPPGLCFTSPPAPVLCSTSPPPPAPVLCSTSPPPPPDLCSMSPPPPGFCSTLSPPPIHCSMSPPLSAPVLCSMSPQPPPGLCSASPPPPRLGSMPPPPPAPIWPPSPADHGRTVPSLETPYRDFRGDPMFWMKKQI